MPEMILPGTYIEVRAEKLIAPGPIAIGNVGIAGTASRGRIGDPDDPTTVYTPSNIGEAQDIFGRSDPFNAPEDGANPLTLIRALELAFDNGAQRVFAVRVASNSAVQAVYNLTAGANVMIVRALGPGTGYNGFTLTTSAVTAGMVNVTFEKENLVESWRDVPIDTAEFASVINGTHASYDYVGKASTGGGSGLFEVEPPAVAALIDGDQSVTVTATDGTNGADASIPDYEIGLNALADANVHIVALAGQHGANAAAALVSHVENASSDLMRRERIAVIGSGPNPQPATLVAPAQDSGRLVFVTPGLKTIDAASENQREIVLPGAYTAAAVAGRISSLDPHFSPTNKTINAGGLEVAYNGAQLEQFVLGRTLALEDRNGALRVVRGVTTSTNTAWAQITTRRIVDFARFGVRAAADPFIGKLNNERVRQALKGSINALLADMVDREMLISYELDVSATREQQIRGIVVVTMVVRPTFSIDYIRVVMYLE